MTKREEKSLATPEMPGPDRLIVYLQLPGAESLEQLAEGKQDPALANIPIVVQTSSEAPADVHRAYSLHANCYITKPCDLDEFSRTMRVLAEFWVTIAKLPDGGNHAKAN